MNPLTKKEAENIFSSILKNTSKVKKTEIVVCPPFIYLESLKKIGRRISFGAQNIFWEPRGAYTGEISPNMLKNLGVEYIIIGHSERRHYLGETDEMINKKVKAALGSGLKVILCVGENLSIRRRGKKAVENFIKNQLALDLKETKNYKLITKNLIIAYEPVWAIGTGMPDKPENAIEIIKFIKKILNSKFQIPNSKIIYGGSVDAKNIESFMRYKEIEGVLVGGASLKPEEIRKIIEITAKIV